MEVPPTRASDGSIGRRDEDPGIHFEARRYFVGCIMPGTVRSTYVDRMSAMRAVGDGRLSLI